MQTRPDLVEPQVAIRPRVVEQPPQIGVQNAIIIRRNIPAREALAALSQVNLLSDEQIEAAKKRANEEQHAAWDKVPKTYTEKMKMWNDQMDVTFSALKPEVQVSVKKVFEQMGIKSDTSVDWDMVVKVMYPDNQADIEGFLKLIKSMPDIRNHLDGAKFIASIFGKEASEIIFPKKEIPLQTWNNQTRERVQVVNRSFEQGKISRAKRDKFKDHLQTSSTNQERIMNFNGVTFEGFRAEEVERMKEIMKMLPAELITQLKQVSVDTQGSGGDFRGCMRLKEGKMRINKELFNRQDGALERTITHEIGGHALVDMVGALDKNKLQELCEMWGAVISAHPDLLKKDSYAQSYVNGERGLGDRIRRGKGIRDSVDEFWSDRMSEYFHAKALGVSTSDIRVRNHSVKGNPFTEQESKVIEETCEKSYQMWQMAIGRNN